MPKKINNLNQPATKGDLLGLETKLSGRIDSVETKLSGRIDSVRTELKSDFRGLKQEFNDFKSEFDDFKDETSTSLDQILTIVQRLDQDRIVIIDRVRRLEQKPSDL